MKRKIIGFLAALVLAAIGTTALVAYVDSARDRAVAGEALVGVYVVDKAIPKGAPLDKITAAVKETKVPAKVLADDAVTDLHSVGKDLVAGVDLEPGEQLLSSRLVSASRARRGSVPSGLQEMTVSLDPSRALGGALRAGDTVGVVLSYKPFDLPKQADQSPNMTHLTFQKVVVTAVQFADGDGQSTNSQSGDNSSDGDATAGPPPTSLVLVTLALSAPQVEQVAFAAEFGKIWLTAEDTDASEAGTRVVTLGNAYDPAAKR